MQTIQSIELSRQMVASRVINIDVEMHVISNQTVKIDSVRHGRLVPMSWKKAIARDISSM